MTMSTPAHRLVCLGLFAFVLSAVLAGACYEVPHLEGFYACAEDAECGDGLVCDDGVCCGEQVQPLCVGRVLDGGVCTDGGVATRYYRDQDGDGFGNPTEPVLRCAVPRTFTVATNGDDCNDNPDSQGALFHPNAAETCDLLDNDCDGEIDEGLPGSLWFEDADGDGYGDPGRSRVFCKPPPGWVASSNDCEPHDARIHPGAIEICNGLDDNCNGTRDDIPQEGEPCTDPSRPGVCAQGARSCIAGLDACRQTVFPSAEVCDGLDNNCDTRTDEKPDCGGPAVFAADPGVAFGARYLATSLNGVPRNCVRDNPASTPADTVTPPTGTTGVIWSGSGGGSHVFWAERDGGTWDLSRTGANLKLFATFRGDGGVNSSGSRWADHNQPVVLLCGPGGFLRLVHAGRLLQGSGTVSIGENIPMPLPDGGIPGGQWVLGSFSSPDIPAVLRQVKRVELLIQLETVSPTPTFQATFSRGDFGFP
jgi:hypothetical protein